MRGNLQGNWRLCPRWGLNRPGIAGAVHLGLKSEFVQWRFEQKAAAIKRKLFRELYEKAGRLPLSKLASCKPIEDSK